MKYKIFLLIFVLSLISSTILTSDSSAGICKLGNGCDTVNSSAYGSTFGIKNSVYGIFIFSFMIFLILFHIKKQSRHTRNIIHLAIIVGSSIAIYFLYLQVFIIKAFCKLCLLVDFGLLAALFLMFYLWKH